MRTRFRPVAALFLAGALAACGSLSAPPATYDLTAPQIAQPLRPGRAQLVVAEPAALQVLDGDRLVARTKDGQVSYLPGAQWADRLPALVQARLIQTFENARRLGTVGRPGDKLTPDATLATELRTFEIDTAGAPRAVVAISARIVSESTGRIAAAQIFTAEVPASGTGGPAAAEALDRALQNVLVDLVGWATTRV